MINSKKVIERFESNPELNFSNDKSLMPIAETVRDWLTETKSEAKTVERILTHQTLNDYEKAAGLFFLGSLIATRILVAAQTADNMIQSVNKMIESISNGDKNDC